MRLIDIDLAIKTIGKTLNNFDTNHIPLTDAVVEIGKALRDIPAVDIKTELAKEIFEEIEEARERWESIYKCDHFRDGDAYCYLQFEVDDTIAELKNKYIKEDVEN